MSEEKSFDEDKYSEYVQKYIWLVRPCEDYENEAKECKLIRSRFHQYFIDGETRDCNPWIKDAKNCSKCMSEHNNEACASIILNESKRRLERLENHNKNDIWERRTKPPEDWSAPLPEWWQRNNKESILILRDQEFRDHIKNNEPKLGSCVIL